MKLRLLSVLLAAAGLGGCATYDYAGGGSGGYYHGRPTAESQLGVYGSYGRYGGYGSYGAYGGYPPYGYGRYGYGSRYYGSYGYSPYYGHYPYPRYYVLRPQPPGHGHDRDDHRDRREKRPPPWRTPDGRYLDNGGTMIPPGPRAQAEPGVPRQLYSTPDRPRVMTPQAMSAPRPSAQMPRQSSRVDRSERLQQREERDLGIRDVPN